MKIIVEARDGWLADARVAVGESGNNDDEHELLTEIVDAIERDTAYARAQNEAMADSDGLGALHGERPVTQSYDPLRRIPGTPRHN